MSTAKNNKWVNFLLLFAEIFSIRNYINSCVQSNVAIICVTVIRVKLRNLFFERYPTSIFDLEQLSNPLSLVNIYRATCILYGNWTIIQYLPKQATNVQECKLPVLRKDAEVCVRLVRCIKCLNPLMALVFLAGLFRSFNIVRSNYVIQLYERLRESSLKGFLSLSTSIKIRGCLEF